MMLGRILGKFVLALVLAGVGTYFLIGSDTTAKAQTAPSYKVEWTATKLIVLDFEKLFYPWDDKGEYDPDPADYGAKTILAIGPAEWFVKFSVKTCDDNIPTCFNPVYEETWTTGPIGADNCYKVPANCTPPNGKYAGLWNWSLGSENLNACDEGWNCNNLRTGIELKILPVTDEKLYVSNNDILNSPPFCNGFICGRSFFGKGPGFLGYYLCSPGGGWFNTGCGEYPMIRSFYTSGAYAWQIGGSRFDENNVTDAQGATSVGLYMPTKWFVKGTIL